MTKRLVAGAMSMLLASPLLLSAQTAGAAYRQVRDTRDSKAPAWDRGAGLQEADDLIGTPIKNAEGRDLGEIDQLLIARNGKVSHVVIRLGGRAGVAEKKVVVPWSDLKFAPLTEGKKNAITMVQAELERAPRYERSAQSDVAPAASPRTEPTVKDGGARQ